MVLYMNRVHFLYTNHITITRMLLLQIVFIKCTVLSYDLMLQLLLHEIFGSSVDRVRVFPFSRGFNLYFPQNIRSGGKLVLRIYFALLCSTVSM